MPADEDNRKSTKHRSPAYPSVSLPLALERLKEFWKAFSKHPVDRKTVLKEWGYTSATGPAARLIAALKQFGLVSESEGLLKITDAGVALMTYPSSKSEYKEAMRECLKAPKIYNQLLTRYGSDMPSRSLIEGDLIRELDFNPKTVGPFINHFIESVDFVNSLSGDVPESASEGSPSAGAIEQVVNGSLVTESAQRFTNRPTAPIVCIENEFDLPNAKLQLRLMSDNVITDEDLDLVDYYLEGFQRVVRAKAKRDQLGKKTPDGIV